MKLKEYLIEVKNKSYKATMADARVSIHSLHKMMNKAGINSIAKRLKKISKELNTINDMINKRVHTEKEKK